MGGILPLSSLLKRQLFFLGDPAKQCYLYSGFVSPRHWEFSWDLPQRWLLCQSHWNAFLVGSIQKMNGFLKFAWAIVQWLLSLWTALTSSLSFYCFSSKAFTVGILDKTRNEVCAESPTEEIHFAKRAWEEPELAFILRLVSLSTHLHYLLLSS